MSGKFDCADIQVGGIQKTSLIDFPGRVSCVLFLRGCNFSCPYCHNPGLVNAGNPVAHDTTETVYEFLAKRKEFLGGVVISGGEPTLQKGLPLLCEKIKNMGYAVKLDTNGSRPGVIRQLIQHGLVDYIAMDIKTDPARYSPLVHETFQPSRLLSSIRMIMESSPAYEFRTTCVGFFVNDQIIRNIGRIIRGASLYALQGVCFKDVLNPKFFQNKTAAMNEKGLMHLKAIAEPWVKQCIVRQLH